MDAAATAFAYHDRTKHRLDRYAAGPGSLDWDAQPNPFRHWSDTARLALDRRTGTAPAGVPDLAGIAWLLRHAAAVTAWKQYGPARWSLRAHPSSGNLHPTETWLCARGIAGLADGLYHYQAEDHSLELRADLAAEPEAGPSLHLAYSSVAWREAWKYGERAFRYCQLDMGHVLGALAYAAALLGWRPRLLTPGADELAACLGLDRAADYAGVEPEEAEAAVCLFGAPAMPRFSRWHGRPGLLDGNPMYRWPVIDEVAAATRGRLPPLPAGPAEVPAGVAAETLLRRRSAQAFDGRSELPVTAFRRLLGTLAGAAGSPAWALWTYAARVHPVLFVHRVEGLAPGLYCLPRSEAGLAGLAGAMRREFAWTPADPELPLYKLVGAKAERTARTVSCHQDIASQCAFSVMFVAEFAGPVGADPAAWRHLHWEAGLLGHALTLAAEAEGWRGTGIGCFFDDADQELLGLADDRYRVIYHYAVGMAVDDARLSTLPAYD
ncbi:SagB/ThcOx family dehydrogenase [Parasulfuritortus cantonensis]|uniref:SagB/ThcOx family dehydrogenase n=1 Tax=Parasulfuritortus cantonensis TaxID=2528202 RepID=A0A4R1B5C4_9PROT|nr:nitroreductase family protein [Parasulfuritortus cantonensis]TCJ11687.1 SagB/ThcOx family dehydrogenase [Parasulfuritortus cantonensis]